jgi:hypothetical protein
MIDNNVACGASCRRLRMADIFVNDKVTAPTKQTRPRGRSKTKRKNATNAEKAEPKVSIGTTSNPPDAWWRSLAMFGDSRWSLVASLLMLLCAIGMSLFPDEDSSGLFPINGLSFYLSWSSILSPSTGSWFEYERDSSGSLAVKCSLYPNAIPALRPGDLNALFERISQVYSNSTTAPDGVSVKVHSRPNSTRSGHENKPWVVTFDGFLSEAECDVMIHHGHEQGFDRSMDVGQQNGNNGRVFGKVTTWRTSETAWCSSQSGCRHQTIPSRLHQRISKLLSIPEENSEDFQILKYIQGQCK